MAAVIIILLAGSALRLYDLDDPPLDFHPTRQLHSALIARGMFYAGREDVPDWQRERAVQQQHAEGLIEPQVMETLTALTYRIVGEADLRIPRLYAILFWCLGGVGLLLLAKETSGLVGALVALTLYLFLPYGVTASRAFQPDPLMVALSIWSWWAMQRWLRRRSTAWAVTAGLLGGLAIYIKTTAVFFVLGGWAGIALAGLGVKAFLRDRRFWLATILMILPYALYHVYATAGLGLLQEQFSLRFFPRMWLDPAFYLRWSLKAIEVVPLPWLVLAAAGVFTLAKPAWRALSGGAWAGYLLFGLLFSYYVSTHDYYHLILIPLAALGVGAIAQALGTALHTPSRVSLLILSGLLLITMASYGWETRSTLKREDYRPHVARTERIAALFEPQDRIVSLAEDYSTRLRYWGWLDASHWFGRGDFELRALAGQPLDFSEYFEQQTDGKDYFLITDMVELARQPELKTLLDNRYALLTSAEDYLLYDLRKAP